MRLGQVVQHVEVYNMDAILQNFRRSFALSSPFFHSLSLDSPTTMEELYKRANKYSTLVDNIRAITQTIMITSKPPGNIKLERKKSFESSQGQGKNRKWPRDQSWKKRETPKFTPLNIIYERLLPLIRDLPNFKWPVPIQTNPFRETRPCVATITRIIGMRTIDVEA